jgi:thiamine-monophosphate kinase
LNTRGSTAARHLVAEIGERALIDRIRQRLPAPPAGLVVGPGDDAAVVETMRAALQILTTDALVEGVHFDLRFSAPADIGYKALAVNVSDIAAMGGTPQFALLSLMLPPSCAVETIDGIIDGLLALAAETRVTVAGGNITSSPGPLIVDVTVTGWAKPRKVLTRAGGRPGDALYVTGTVGAAAAGLGWLRSEPACASRPPDGPLAECVARHRRPVPRTRVGMILGRSRAASTCMDLSDGLADAIRQIARASGTGACIDASKLPLHPAATEWFASAGIDPVDASISGGDDYELLFTVPPRRKGRLRAAARLFRGVPVTQIGELTAEPALVIVREGVRRELPAGFAHF